MVDDALSEMDWLVVSCLESVLAVTETVSDTVLVNSDLVSSSLSVKDFVFEVRLPVKEYVSSTDNDGVWDSPSLVTVDECVTVPESVWDFSVSVTANERVIVSSSLRVAVLDLDRVLMVTVFVPSVLLDNVAMLVWVMDGMSDLVCVREREKNIVSLMVDDGDTDIGGVTDLESSTVIVADTEKSLVLVGEWMCEAEMVVVMENDNEGESEML